jgi:hypothetical protein
VIEVLRVCYAHDVPVTTRGAGTGNYGQAMPMRGGCVMHMKNMARVKEIGPAAWSEPGIIIKDLDAATCAHSGQELRMTPSTFATATIGGFIAGGSGGVGSCTWGALRDLGNIIRLRVVTMEAEPRVLELTGEELARVSHAYRHQRHHHRIEMPLAPAYDWSRCSWLSRISCRCRDLRRGLANQDGILIKLASAFEAPIGKDYFQRVKPHVEADDTLIGLMVAPHSMDGFLTFLGRRPGARLIYRSDDNDWPKTPGPVFEYGWNHTTLRALKVDPSITYLQVRYGFPSTWSLSAEDARDLRRGGSAASRGHARKRQGDVRGPASCLSRPSGWRRSCAIHEEMGCDDLQPASLHAGGRRAAVDRRAAAELQEGGRPQGPSEPRQDDRLGRSGFRLRDDVRLSGHDAQTGGCRVRGFAASAPAATRRPTGAGGCLPPLAPPVRILER